MSDAKRPRGSLPLDRDKTAADRDTTSSSQDETARGRDERAQGRDDRAVGRDERAGVLDLDAAFDRAGARSDRLAARGDRVHARDDRSAAASDRSLSASERADLLLDDLTGVYRRAAGFIELEREVIRAERTGHGFVLAFVDIDHLKEVNDVRGHGAGDLLLKAVVTSLRNVLREYDVIVRFGGDEFLCGLSDVDIAEVERRLDKVNVELRAREQASVTYGLAEREQGEGILGLIARADAGMYQVRADREPGPDD